GGGGCLWERNVDHRLARVQLGATSRRIATDPTPPTPAPGVARATTTPEVASAPPEAGMIGSLQFTMRLLPHLYAGGEVEAGPLARHGSYFGGAYGVIGGEVTSTRGTLSVELAGGRQWVR